MLALPGPAVDVVVIAAPVITFIAALLIPIINGLMTKYTLGSFWKGLITIVLNGIVALFTTAAMDDGTAAISGTMAWTWGVGVVISLASYLMIYKPLDVTSSTTTGKLAPNVGIGPS